jgi:AhpD family alkylhydroperoxidase
MTPNPAPGTVAPVAVAPVTSDRAPLLARPYFDGGDPGPITATLAHVPELLDTAMPFLSMILGPSSIDLRTKELVIVRTSAVVGCTYCTQTHAVVALDAGIEREQVRTLCDREHPPAAFDDARETALLAWVDAVALPGEVADELAQRLRSHFDDPRIVELTALVGATLLLNRFCTSLRLPTAPGVLRRLDEEGLR